MKTNILNSAYGRPFTTEDGFFEIRGTGTSIVHIFSRNGNFSFEEAKEVMKQHKENPNSQIILESPSGMYEVFESKHLDNNEFLLLLILQGKEDIRKNKRVMNTLKEKYVLYEKVTKDITLNYDEDGILMKDIVGYELVSTTKEEPTIEVKDKQEITTNKTVNIWKEV